MDIQKLAYLLLFLLFLSCHSIKKPKSSTSETTLEAKEMIKNGFKKGLIIASYKDSDCPYIIEFQKGDNPEYLDPVDLPDKYKKDSIAIWFKFTASRRVKRCQKANPVTLNDSICIRD